VPNVETSFFFFFFLRYAIMRVTCSRETGRTGAKHTLSNERLAKCERLQKSANSEFIASRSANGNGIICSRSTWGIKLNVVCIVTTYIAIAIRYNNYLWTGQCRI